jgi:Glycosyl hydrolase family 53
MSPSKRLASAQRALLALTAALSLHPFGTTAASASASSSPRSVPARLFVGLAEVPPESEGFSAETMEKWYGKAVAAGVNLQQITPKWNEIERSDGSYDFKDFDFKAAMAKKFGLPLYINLRVIDTLARSMPEPYAAWHFDDPRMTAKLTSLLQAMRARNPSDVRWIAIGNEVDPYFMKHSDEVQSYRQLLLDLTPVVKKLFPGAAVCVNFTFFGSGQLNKELKSIYDVSEIFSVTYYPFNADFTFRSPDVVKDDFKVILAAAAGKPVMFQEVGYASSALLGSSPEIQARFLQVFFDQLRNSQPAVIGMTYLFMSDLPKSVVEGFGQYYNQPGSEKFLAFLATLGLFDRAGNPKPAWEVFERNASSK